MKELSILNDLFISLKIELTNKVEITNKAIMIHLADNTIASIKTKKIAQQSAILKFKGENYDRQ